MIPLVMMAVSNRKNSPTEVELERYTGNQKIETNDSNLLNSKFYDRSSLQ